MIDETPPRQRNWGRVAQGFFMAVILGVLALPMVWFFGRDSDRMTGLVFGIILNFALLTLVLAAA